MSSLEYWELRWDRISLLRGMGITWFSRTVDGLEALAPDRSTGWGEECDALILGSSLGLHHVDSDFVLAGEEQAWEVDVVLLSPKKHMQESVLIALTDAHLSQAMDKTSKKYGHKWLWRRTDCPALL